MTLTFEQIRAYFEARHPGQKIGTRAKASVKCIFHDDRTPSCTLFLDGAGGFHCNGCGAAGNVFQFEARFCGCTLAEAEAKVAELTGAKASFGSFAKLGPVIAAYDYRDDDERVLFQKRRYQPEGEQKTFRIYRPGEQGNWIAGIDPPDSAPTKRVLYNQPRVVTANVVAVCEGEKDADTVAQCGLWAERTTLRMATTCNFDGAWKPGEKPKWLPAYNVYFAGKFVVVFADNDENGETWAQAVAQNAHPYAHTVKIIRLPGLPAKGDVSDWLGNRTAKELEVEIAKAPNWRPASVSRLYPMFQDAVQFAAEAETTVDWLIDGIVPRAGNGIIAGHPKASKTFTSLDLGMAASCGVAWMGLRVPKPIKTAIVSREDEAGLTRRRIKKLIAGRPEYSRLEDRMLINTRHHQSDFKVTRDDHMDALIEQLGRFGAELVVLDVFRSIHDVEENDNTEVAKVLEKVSRIQTELKCACALVHHIAKVDGSNIFKGLRGASAIHGWMEWGIGISVTNPEEEDRAQYIRCAEFESKEATTSAVSFRIVESPDHSAVSLQAVDRQKANSGRRATTATIVPLPATRERKDWA
jgi:putative DNA primase/helicase